MVQVLVITFYIYKNFIILLLTIDKIIIGASNDSIFKYYNSIIILFSLASHLFIALPTFRWKKLLHLTLLFHFCIRFVDWFMAYFLYCFTYSYRSSNYCDSNSCQSFTHLKALAKSNGNLIAIAFKSEKERQISLSQ